MVIYLYITTVISEKKAYSRYDFQPFPLYILFLFWFRSLLFVLNSILIPVPLKNLLAQFRSYSDSEGWKNGIVPESHSIFRFWNMPIYALHPTFILKFWFLYIYRFKFDIKHYKGQVWFFMKLFSAWLHCISLRLKIRLKYYKHIFIKFMYFQR